MTAAENAGRDSFVLLRIGARRFALPAGLVAELAPPVKLHTFPHTSPSVAGVIVRRRCIVPVYDAGPLLVGRSSAGQQFYLIARRDFGGTSELGAILVSGECEMAEGEAQPPDADRPAYVVGTLVIGEDSVDVLDLEALVASASAQPSEPARTEVQP
ncbi:MAG: chemotaxis protein CheW [Candidatus Acidiferrales bacterium]|jgi:chemotaxis signal transduction protein